MNSREGNFNLANVGVVSGWVRVTTGLIRDLGWALQRSFYTEWGLNGCFKPPPLCKTCICSLEQDCCVLGRGCSPHWLTLMWFVYEHWFSELSHLYWLRAGKCRSQQCGSILVLLCTEFNWVLYYLVKCWCVLLSKIHSPCKLQERQTLQVLRLFGQVLLCCRKVLVTPLWQLAFHSQRKKLFSPLWQIPSH